MTRDISNVNKYNDRTCQSNWEYRTSTSPTGGYVRPGTTMESLAGLRPAFSKDGTITALGLGPAKSEDLDKITGNLTLL